MNPRITHMKKCSGSCNRIHVDHTEMSRHAQNTFTSTKKCEMCSNGAVYLGGKDLDGPPIRLADCDKAKTDEQRTIVPSLRVQMRDRRLHQRYPALYKSVMTVTRRGSRSPRQTYSLRRGSNRLFQSARVSLLDTHGASTACDVGDDEDDPATLADNYAHEEDPTNDNDDNEDDDDDDEIEHCAQHVLDTAADEDGSNARGNCDAGNNQQLGGQTSDAARAFVMRHLTSASTTTAMTADEYTHNTLSAHNANDELVSSDDTDTDDDDDDNDTHVTAKTLSPLPRSLRTRSRGGDSVEGVCCFCGEECNEHSQACGACIRSASRKRTFDTMLFSAFT